MEDERQWDWGREAQHGSTCPPWSQGLGEGELGILAQQGQRHKGHAQTTWPTWTYAPESAAPLGGATLPGRQEGTVCASPQGQASAARGCSFLSATLSLTL